jgi:hypothetical protein
MHFLIKPILYDEPYKKRERRMLKNMVFRGALVYFYLHWEFPAMIQF